MGREPTSQPRAVRAARRGGCYDLGGCSPAHPGLSGLLGTGCVFMGRILTSPPRAARAARGGGCFEWEANPPAHPGLSGLLGAGGVFSMWR